jgi:hypothetical protein
MDAVGRFLLGNRGLQHVEPSADRVGKHAFAADEPALEQQEVDQEMTQIVRGGQVWSVDLDERKRPGRRQRVRR